MKYLLALLSVILFSCSKDDDRSNQSISDPSGLILGKWYYKEFVVDGIVTTYDDHEKCGKDYVEFYGLNQIRGIDVFNCIEETDWMGSYSLYNNALSVSNGSQTRTVEVIRLSATELVYEYDFDSDNNGSNEHHVEKFER